MREIIAKLPLGHAHISHGTVTLAELALPRLTSVAPFVGQDKAVAKALKSMGLTFPNSNSVSQSKGEGALIWTGRNQAFLLAADPTPLQGLAALTDQSDGWCGLTLTGAGATDVLLRLVPVDLRLSALPAGACIRTGLSHMNLILWRNAPEAFTLLVFRSMARTAWHEVEEAMRAVAARAAC
ncbi:MAG: sarcosine oxidase subunit gamma [Rhodobacteraceae bacterium]|nr:sarcosine oxidase subunit gamma [Paracoccaceae bacterium]